MEEVFAMSWERTAEATCTAPPERIWSVLLDGRHWNAWNPGVQWMTLEGPPEPGTVVTVKPKGAPQTAFRIESAVPNRLLALELTIGPLATLRLRWELRTSERGTTIAGSAATSGPLAGLLLSRVARRIGDALDANLARLAERASASDAEQKSAVVADRASDSNND
jgi:uncharacterized protein YndB with AHSA1/START domain